MKLSIPDGAIATALATTGGGIEMAFPNTLAVHVAGILLILVGLGSLVLNVRVVNGQVEIGHGERFVTRFRNVTASAILLGIFVGAIAYSIASGVHLLIIPKPLFVRTEFLNLKEENPGLGPVQSYAVAIPQNKYRASVYQASFPNATILWDNKSRNQTIIFNNSKGYSEFISFSDNQPESVWANEAYVRSKLGIPPNIAAPFHGTARWLWNNKSMADAFGYMNWHCLYDGVDVYRQDFKNGFIMGPLRTEYTGGDDGGTIYAFVYDKGDSQHGRWFTDHASRGPPCKAVWHSAGAVNQSHGVVPSAPQSPLGIEQKIPPSIRPG